MLTLDHQFAEKGVQGTRIVELYLSDLAADSFTLSPTDTRQALALKGLALRATGFIQALARLDEVHHFQLSLAANRAIFELLVDVVLVSNLPLDQGLEKLDAWELSARLKYARTTVEYKSRVSLTPLEVPLVGFIEQAEEHVKDLRRKYWPANNGKGRHPPRWTGNDLLTDAREAGRLHDTDELEHYYETEYRRACWLVHGSTLTAFRGLDVDMRAALFGGSHSRSSRFALEAAKVVLMHLGLFEGRVRARHKGVETEHGSCLQ
jgi:hypothetical protein